MHTVIAIYESLAWAEAYRSEHREQVLGNRTLIFLWGRSVDLLKMWVMQLFLLFSWCDTLGFKFCGAGLGGNCPIAQWVISRDSQVLELTAS